MKKKQVKNAFGLDIKTLKHSKKKKIEVPDTSL